jgi:hypothetical protein
MLPRSYKLAKVDDDCPSFKIGGGCGYNDFGNEMKDHTSIAVDPPHLEGIYKDKRIFGNAAQSIMLKN